MSKKVPHIASPMCGTFLSIKRRCAVQSAAKKGREDFSKKKI